MGKFQELVEQKGYKIEPIKTIRVPTDEEYKEAKQRNEREAALAAIGTGTATSAATGGLLAGLPGLEAAAMKPVIQASGPLDRPPVIGQTGFTVGTEQQVMDRKVANAEKTIEDLEGKYAEAERKVAVLSQSSDPADWEQLEDAQAEMNGYLEQLTAAKDNLGALEWDANNRLVFEADMEEVGKWSAEEIAAAERYFETGRNSEIPKSLVDRYGGERLEELLESYRLAYNQQKSQEYSAKGEELGKSLGIFGVVPQVGAGLVGTAGNLLGFVGTGGSTARNGTGRYKGPDPYRSGTWISDWASGVGKGAAEKTPEQLVDFLEVATQAVNPYADTGSTSNFRPQLYDASRGTKAGEVIDTVGSGAYQVVNTAADTVARAYLGGKLFGAGTNAAKAFSLGLAGARSYNDTFNSVLRRGGTAGQAVVLGVFNGGTEIATEYIPLDEWWKIAKNGSGSVATALKAAARQGAMEMTQEEIGFLATTMAEYAVLREKSEYQVLLRELMDQNIPREEAERMVWEEFGRQAAGVAATSFFSGGLSTAGAQAFHALMPGAVTQEQTAQTEQAPQTQQTKQTPFIAAENATTQTQQTQETAPAAETVSEPQTPLQVAQESYRQNNTVTNSQAEAILADSGAVAVLQREAGLELGGTKAQDRAAVKAAVARLTVPTQAAQDTATDLAESIASDFAEEGAQAAQAAQEPQGDMDAAVDTALRGETYQRPQTAQEQVQMPAVSAQVAEQAAVNVPAQENAERKPAMGAADRGFTRDYAPEMADSKLYTNTYPNATDPGVKASGEAAAKEAPDIGKYEKRTEKSSLSAAEARTRTDEDIMAEYEILIREPQWSGEDNDTAMIVLKRLLEKGEVNQHRNLSIKQREQATNAGQLVQSFAKYSRMDAMTAASEGLSALYDMSRDDVDKRYWGKADGKTDAEKFENWVVDIGKKMAEIGKAIDEVEDGDLATMRQIVRELAQFRRTTAWFGISNNLTRAADKGIDRLDFETLRTVAKAQLGQIPNDYKKVSVGQVIKSLATMNMLSSLVTVNRNLVGNSTTGLMDAFSDSSSGRLADIVLSNFTGQRTVGNDIKHGKEYFRGAWDAACMASLFTELAIPMDNAAYTDATRTFSPQGNLLTRFLSGCEMGLKYALEVTDKFYEGGAQASVMASLKDMGAKSGLTEEQAQSVASGTGARRTYKDDRALAKATSGVKAAMNYVGTGDVGAGDVFIPFAKVPANVVHVGIDYSAGVVEGLGQMIKIVKDAKAGKTIDPVAQRAAATNFGRGVSGAAMIAMFTALAVKGAIKVFDDKDRDKAALEQSLGYDDAVWNLSASWRLLTGKDGAWKPDDIKINLGFLQPFNAQMYIGAELAKEDSFWGMVKKAPGATVSGIAQSIMDIPMFQTFEDIVDIFKSFGEVGEDQNAVMDATGKLVGNVATRAIPSWLRQTAQFIDPNYRDTSGDNALEKAGKQFMAAIPGVSKLLPEKYDGLGNPQKRYTDPVLGFFNTFISPGKITGATAPEASYDIMEYLGELEAAMDGEKAMYPDYKAPTEFKWEGKTVEMDRQQQNEYQRVYGENIADMYTQFLGSEAFRSFPAEIQLGILKDAKTLAGELAKAYIVGDGTGKPKNLGETVNGLMRGEVGSVITKGANSFLDGDTESGMAQMESALSVYDSMNQSGKDKMLEESGGRVKYLLLAHDAGMDTEAFFRYYQHYGSIDKLDMSAADKDAEWSLYLQREREQGRITAEQYTVLQGNMKFWEQFPGNAVKVHQLQEEGLSSEEIRSIVGAVDLLKPLEGYSQVTNWQTYEAIATSGASVEDIDAAMLAYMPDYNPNAKSPDRTELKYQDIRGMGFTPEQYVMLAEIYRREDAAGGKGTKKRTKDAFDAIPNISPQMAAEIYAIFSGEKYSKK